MSNVNTVLLVQGATVLERISRGEEKIDYRILGQCARHFLERCGKTVSEFVAFEEGHRHAMVTALRDNYFPDRTKPIKNGFAHQELRKLGVRMLKLATSVAFEESDRQLVSFLRAVRNNMNGPTVTADAAE